MQFTTSSGLLIVEEILEPSHPHWHPKWRVPEMNTLSFYAPESPDELCIPHIFSSVSLMSTALAMQRRYGKESAQLVIRATYGDGT
jgi:hypothetical protein